MDTTPDDCGVEHSSFLLLSSSIRIFISINNSGYVEEDLGLQTVSLLRFRLLKEEDVKDA